VTFQLANLRKHSIRLAPTSSISAADKAQAASAAGTLGLIGRLLRCASSLPQTLFHHWWVT
jgi:hypothetical protein